MLDKAGSGAANQSAAADDFGSTSDLDTDVPF